MDNGAILNTNSNELNTFDNLRASDENLRQEAANPRVRPAESTPGTQSQNDLVELSRESINLARLEENADLTSNRLAEPRFVEETLLEPANTDLLTELGTGTETTGLVGANLENTTNVDGIEATALANENVAEITANTTNTNNESTEAEVMTEREETAAVGEALETEAAAAAPTAPDNIVVEAGAGPTTIIGETEPRPEPEETAIPLEEQANRLTQNTNILTATNGLTGGATTPESETPDEAARNEQQILLQNVGSQLAQVLPPASVFSVVG